MNNNDLNNEQDSLWTGDVPPHQVPNHPFKSTLLTALSWEIQKLMHGQAKVVEAPKKLHTEEVSGQGLTAEDIKTANRAHLPYPFSK
jgi:hypothetical protein